MDWSKLNMDEISYYCKTGRCLFECSPFSLQMEEIVLMFHYYGIARFTVEDIQEFYQKMQIRKLKSAGTIKPAPSKIRKTAERMSNIKCTDDGAFEIIPADMGLYQPFDTGYYASEIAKMRQSRT